jgi:hypothetical protein
MAVTKLAGFLQVAGWDVAQENVGEGKVAEYSARWECALYSFDLKNQAARRRTKQRPTNAKPNNVNVPGSGVPAVVIVPLMSKTESGDDTPVQGWLWSRPQVLGVGENVPPGKTV